MRSSCPMSLTLIAGTLATVGLAGHAAAQPLLRTWTGPNAGLWNNAANWNPNSSYPINVPPFPLYEAVIPAGAGTVSYNIPAAVPAPTVSLLTLGVGRQLTLTAGTELLVSGVYTACGHVDVTNARFTAESPSFTCGTGTFAAHAGGQVLIGGPTYATNSLGAATILSADGVGALIDMNRPAQPVTAINAAYGLCCSSFQQTISASNSGSINLGSLQTITGPADDERLHITVASGGSINLSSLATITGSVNGSTRFIVSDPSTISLPAIQSIGRTLFEVSGGGVIDATGAAPASYNISPFTFAGTIMSANGAGSTLNLRSFTSLNDAWGVCCSSFQHTISATNGGLIDLRNVTTLTGPVDDERLHLVATGNGSINLSALTTVTGATNAVTWFETDTGGSILLPNAQNLSFVGFDLSGNTQVNLPALVSLTRAQCKADSGAKLIAAGPIAATFNSSTLNSQVPILTADGAGSLLDLRSLVSISDAWGVCCSSFQHTISATNGGLIDLRNVTTLTGPADDERLHITVASGGSINLSSLATITGSVNGSTRFIVSDPSTISLPAIQSIGRTLFEVSGGGVIDATGAAPASYNISPFTFAGTIMSANGAGSTLNLRSFTSINDAWGVCCNSFQHTISATNGGLIDLRNVTTLTGPVDDERLHLVATGGTINLSSLSLIAPGSGSVNADVSDAGTLDLGALDIKAGSTWNISDANSLVRTASLKCTAGPGVTINLSSPGTRLEVAGNLQFANNISIPASAGATIAIGGDLSYTHTLESSLLLEKATVQFNGSGTQRCEIGGSDLGVNGACFLGNSNFGFGQLIVGRKGQATSLRLADQVDNGNRGGRPEALYLWGSFDRGNPPTIPCAPTAPQVNGLRIHSGSTLILDGAINVYTFHNGQWICLMPPANGDPIPFDQGFVRRGVCYSNCDGSTGSPRLTANDFQCFINRFAEDSCYANCDGSTGTPKLTANDFICFLSAFASGCT